MKQLSVFVENRPGAMIGVLRLIQSCGIQLISICMADVAEYGLCRILCDKPGRALDALRGEGLAVSESEIFAVRMKDIPGAAADIVSLSSDAGINIAYVYSFIYDSVPYLALRTDDGEAAGKIISDNGLKTLDI